jgi:hypothetical protein
LYILDSGLLEADIRLRRLRLLATLIFPPRSKSGSTQNPHDCLPSLSSRSMHFVLLVELDLTLRQWRTLVLFKHHLQRILLVLFFTAAVLLNAFIANSKAADAALKQDSFIGTFLVIGNAGKWTLSRKRDRNRASRSSRMLMGFHSEWSQRPTAHLQARSPNKTSHHDVRHNSTVAALLHH